MISDLNTEDLADAAYSVVKGLIRDGAFEMGERLPEERICELTRLSRSPVRAALSRLEAEGLVSRKPGRGYRLATYTIQDVREIYGCRALLESEAVRLASDKGFPAAVHRSLRDIVGQMDDLLKGPQSHDDPALRTEFLALNHQFHNLIYDSCGSTYLRRLISTVSDLPLALRNFFNFSSEQLMDSHAAHQKIVAALKKGEGERAAALMREHIWLARDRMVVTEPRRRVRASKHRRSPRGKLILTAATASSGPMTVL